MAHTQQTISDPLRGIAPMQQLAGNWLESMEKVVHLQLDLAQSYTHFALSQWRDALAVEGPEDFPHFMARQSRAAQELSQRMAQDTRAIFETLGSSSERGLQLVPDAARHGAQQSAQQMAEGSERVARAAEEARQEVARAQQQRGSAVQGDGLPIGNYDELSVSEIEERIDKLNAEQIQSLRDYERRNKGRKTLDQAFERRLNA